MLKPCGEKDDTTELITQIKKKRPTPFGTKIKYFDQGGPNQMCSGSGPSNPNPGQQTNVKQPSGVCQETLGFAQSSTFVCALLNVDKLNH